MVYAAVATGLSRIEDGDGDALNAVRGKKVGLVAHPASVTAKFTHARHVLHSAGAKIEVLFGPEHGYGGEAQDMIGVTEARDPATGAVIRSLYGATEAELSPRREWLDGLDAVLIDLQDVGARYYTFVWTAALVMKAAAQCGVKTIVLDRPNPLGGTAIEGAPQRPGYRSFVGLYDVSVRHGLTIGEICTMVRALEALDESCLDVVRMQGWTRKMMWSDTKLPWILPSPNMPTPDTTLVYPGGCLIEATNLSEGRGTTRPFEIIGAPFVDGDKLASRVHAPGCQLRALTFSPTFHKHARTICGGVQVHVTDATAIQSYPLYLKLIAELHQASNGKFAWRTEEYEYVTDRLAIDLLTGGPEFRVAVESGVGLDAVLGAEEDGARRFNETRQQFLLYR
jgi:uncharacterized protein YbbC (DUF1343 family)